MVMRFIVAALLVMHGAMHLSFFMPDWYYEVRGDMPFDLTRSTVLSSIGLDSGLWQPLGIVLVALAFGGLIVGAASLVKLLPPRYGLPAMAVGAIASLASIVVFYHPWLIVGILVDGAILAGVAVGEWLPRAIDA
jgi:hypothetical protein